MEHVKYFPRPNVGTALLLAAGLMVSLHSEAAYTILEGDPADPLILRTMHSPESPRSGSVANVPFVEGKSTLGPRGRKAVLDMIGQAVAADRITIVARPDASDNDAMRTQRGNTLRQMLIANKIPAAKIAIEYSPSGVADTEPRVYLSEVRIGTRPSAPFPAPQIASKPIPPAPAASGLQMSILELLKAGVISTADAERMLSTASRDVPMQTQRSTSPSSNNPSPVRNWKLPLGGTLRDALTAWSQAAGWNVPVWVPTDPYEITEARAIRTDLVSAIAELASALPQLDFEVSKQKKTITVRENNRR